MSTSEFVSLIRSGSGMTMKKKIKVSRAMNALTQEGLSQALGVTRQTILAIEKGKYDPSLELAFRMARYFNTTIEEIFTFEA